METHEAPNPALAVVVFGWAFGKAENVRKYSQLHQKAGWETGQALGTTRAMHKNESSAKAAAALEWVAQRRDADKKQRPFVIHACSNGGMKPLIVRTTPDAA